MASNQTSDQKLDPGQIEAALANYANQMLRSQGAQQQQQAAASQESQQAIAQSQILNQYLGAGAGGGGGSAQAAAPAPGSQMSNLLAILQASGTTQVPPSLQHSQQQQQSSQQQQSAALASLLDGSQGGLASSAAQQKLLAMAQQLSSVNPRLAGDAMAMAQAIATPGNNSGNTPNLPPGNGGGKPGSMLHHHNSHHQAGLTSQHNQAGLQSLSQSTLSALQLQSSPVHPVSSGNSINLSSTDSQSANNSALGSIIAAALASGSLASSSSTNKDLSANISLPASLPSMSVKLSSESSTGGLQSNMAMAGGSGLPKTNAAPAAAIHHHAAAASASTPVSSSMMPHVPIATMKAWSLEQLDTYVKQLRDANQPVPEAVAVLLANVREKEEKLHAKRLANRKSAYASRARKQALYEEITKDNDWLRRQAVILSHLPDPVVVILTDGMITFCSMQVERVIKHKVTDLIAANIEEIMIPSSRESIRQLIRDVVMADQRADNAVPFEVSEHLDQYLPPMLEVNVKARPLAEVAAAEDVSDSSGNPSSNNGQKSSSDGAAPTEMSSLTHKHSMFGAESSEDQDQPPTKRVKICASAKPSAATTESDESSSSENKASANLNKNVELYKLSKNKEGLKQDPFKHNDDVMGASVTSNNADAKLSSLMYVPNEKGKSAEGPSSFAAMRQPEEQVASIRRKHVLRPKMPQGKREDQSSAESSVKLAKKQSGSLSEDSGYQISNESPEESNESPGDSGSSSEAKSSDGSFDTGSRSRPLAPACNVCLIRSDLSTVWCELTSSIRTRPTRLISQAQGGSQKNGKSENNVGSSEKEEKELLLCFRPIREGGKVGEEFRFIPREGAGTDGGDPGSDGSPASSDDAKVSSTSSGSSNNAVVNGETNKATSPVSTETQVQK